MLITDRRRYHPHRGCGTTATDVKLGACICLWLCIAAVGAWMPDVRPDLQTSKFQVRQQLQCNSASSSASSSTSTLPTTFVLLLFICATCCLFCCFILCFFFMALALPLVYQHSAELASLAALLIAPNFSQCLQQISVSSEATCKMGHLITAIYSNEIKCQLNFAAQLLAFLTSFVSMAWQNIF